MNRLVHTLSPRSRRDLRLLALILLLYDTGLRTGELCAVQFANIAFEARSLTLAGAGKPTRTLRFGARTQRIVARYLRRRPPRPDKEAGSPLFVSAHVDPLTIPAVEKMLVRVSRRAGIKNTLQRLRHTFAINFLHAGGDLASLQETLQTADRPTLKRYGQLVSSQPPLPRGPRYPSDELELPLERRRRPPASVSVSSPKAARSGSVL